MRVLRAQPHAWLGGRGGRGDRRGLRHRPREGRGVRAGFRRGGGLHRRRGDAEGGEAGFRGRGDDGGEPSAAGRAGAVARGADGLPEAVRRDLGRRRGDGRGGGAGRTAADRAREFPLGAGVPDRARGDRRGRDRRAAFRAAVVPARIRRLRQPALPGGGRGFRADGCRAASVRRGAFPDGRRGVGRLHDAAAQSDRDRRGRVHRAAAARVRGRVERGVQFLLEDRAGSVSGDLRLDRRAGGDDRGDLRLSDPGASRRRGAGDRRRSAGAVLGREAVAHGAGFGRGLRGARGRGAARRGRAAALGAAQSRDAGGHVRGLPLGGAGRGGGHGAFRGRGMRRDEPHRGGLPDRDRLAAGGGRRGDGGGAVLGHVPSAAGRDAGAEGAFGGAGRGAGGSRAGRGAVASGRGTAGRAAPAGAA